MLAPLQIPAPQPAKKVPGYAMPEAPEHLLTWEFVDAQMQAAEFYWISAVNRNNGPHVVPLWGLWHENRIHFDGSPQTGWAKSLRRNPQIAVHLPDANKVVIVYGRARILEDDELSEGGWNALDSAYQSKYNVQEGSPYWFVEPTKVLAWDGGNLHTMTRWIFGNRISDTNN